MKHKPLSLQTIFFTTLSVIILFFVFATINPVFAVRETTWPELKSKMYNAQATLLTAEDTCQSNLSAYDPEPYTRSEINAATQYYNGIWISDGEDSSNGEPSARPGQSIDLKFNSMEFICASLVEDSANGYVTAEYNNSGSPKESAPNGPSADENEASLTRMDILIENASVVSGGGKFTNEPNGMTVSRENDSRYWFGSTDNFTYEAPNDLGPGEERRIVLRAEVVLIATFNGVSQCPERGTGNIINVNPDEFSRCKKESRNIDFIIKNDSPYIQGLKVAENSDGSHSQVDALKDERVALHNVEEFSGGTNSFAFTNLEEGRGYEIKGYDDDGAADGWIIDHISWCVNRTGCHDNERTADGWVDDVDSNERIRLDDMPNSPGDKSTNPYIDVWIHYVPAQQEASIVLKSVVRDTEGNHTLLQDSDYPYPTHLYYHQRYPRKYSPGYYSSRIQVNNIERGSDFNYASHYVREDDDWDYQGYLIKIGTESCDGNTASRSTRRGWDSVSVRSRIPNDPPDNFLITVCFVYSESTAGSGEVKVYGASEVDVSPDYVRDNKEIDIDVSTYLWPDAGIKTDFSDRPFRFYFAGNYGEANGDVLNNPNTLSVFNSVAEENCPGTLCLKNLPMAYVPADDGSRTRNFRRKDGSRTPNGNNWHAIREESFRDGRGSHSSRRCRRDARYSQKCGGIASNRRNIRVGGKRGNYIKNIEVSNIRIHGIGIDPDLRNKSLQGGIDNSLLQPDVRNLNLPPSSQGPRRGTTPCSDWDNMRSGSDSPTSRDACDSSDSTNLFQGSTYFNVLQDGRSYDFRNSGRSPANFTDDPHNMESIYQNRAVRVGSITGRSLLQDGNDAGYRNGSEPLSYTAGINRVEQTRLKWDEYIDWSQADNKGHYYTNQTRRATGADLGRRRTSTYRNDSFYSGYRQCTNYEKKTYTYSYYWNGKKYTFTYSYWVCTNYTSCNRVSYRDDRRYSKRLYYYEPVTQSRFGWYNTDTRFRNMPYGRNGRTRRSGFWYRYSNNPPWTNTGRDEYWQDTSITSMNNSASSLKPRHSNRWIHDESDPAYTNRRLFKVPADTPRFYYYYDYDVDRGCMYPNGRLRRGRSDRMNWYPNNRSLYEDTHRTSGRTYGLWGNRATFDGRSDGRVDYRWRWRSNWQRVRYENTYNGHYRQLGTYTPDGSADGTLYGLTGVDPAAASRGKSTIMNPTVGINSPADIFGAGGIDSYFSSSDAPSAFLFSNEGIANFQFQSGTYPGYFINPDENKVRSDPDYTTHYRSEPRTLTMAPGNPISDVLQDELDRLLSKKVSRNSRHFNRRSTFNLGQSPGRVYEVNSDLEINRNLTFTNGGGTVIVHGDLIIRGDIDYGSASSRDREDVPSVGFLVFGNVHIKPNVDEIKGAYFATGTFHTGSVLLQGGNSETPNDNPNASDRPFSLDGLAIAHRFVLARQLSGSDNRNQQAESFTYDGRIIVNPPPGFSTVYKYPAVWNEGVPKE